MSAQGIRHVAPQHRKPSRRAVEALILAISTRLYVSPHCGDPLTILAGDEPNVLVGDVFGGT